MALKYTTAVCGVIFPEIMDFLEEYLESLEQQTFKDFDLILINDGINNLNWFRGKYQLNIKDLGVQGTPAELRAIAINYLRGEGYSHVVFTDTDDFFSRNRIEKALELLDQWDLVVNDLTTVSGVGHELKPLYLSERLPNRSAVNLDFLYDKNIIGFSNTAMKLACLRKEVAFHKNLIAVDWYFFSTLLQEGCGAAFTNEAITFYRIHQGNVVGLSSHMDKQRIRKGIQAKLAHYRALSSVNPKLKMMHEKFQELNEKITDDDYAEKYREKIQSLTLRYPLWWEQIKLPEELGL